MVSLEKFFIKPSYVYNKSDNMEDNGGDYVNEPPLIDNVTLSKLTQLETLMLSYNKRITLEFHSIGLLSNLKILTISDINIPLESFKNLTNLERLNLCFNSYITDEHILSIPRLKILDICGNTSVTDNGLMDLKN